MSEMETGRLLPPGASRRLTPEERRARARLAAHSRWARPNAREEQAEAARAAMWKRFEKQVDPNGELPEDQRQVLAMNAAKAYSAKMNLGKSRKRNVS